MVACFGTLNQDFFGSTGVWISPYIAQTYTGLNFIYILSAGTATSESIPFDFAFINYYIELFCFGQHGYGCGGSTRLAAGEFENVCVVDSQNICTGQGYLVLKAAKWAADGLTARAIQMKLQSLAKRVELSFVLDRLDFMAKSGRCSGVLAFGANLLGIKPALEVINGELKVVKKYRGSLPICVGKYITDRLADRDDIEDGLVFISSCQPKPGCMEAVKAGLKKYGHFKECWETDIGTTIGGYSGPGTIGIVFARKEK